MSLRIIATLFAATLLAAPALAQTTPAKPATPATTPATTPTKPVKPVAATTDDGVTSTDQVKACNAKWKLEKAKPGVKTDAKAYHTFMGNCL